jgi:phosphatidylglycerol:prolipoprotein diacylglycerol transferase
MHPILVQLPSKVLFVAALVLAVASFVRHQVQRRRNPKLPASSTPLLMVAGAWALLGLRGGTWIPSAEAFGKPWLPVPIFSYGVMLTTGLVTGWFLAMRLARNDGIRNEDAGAIYMWTAVWSIVGARVLYVITQFHEFSNPIDIVMLNKGGLVAYGGMLGGFLASWYGCRRRKIALLRWADASAPSVVLGTAITRIGCLLFGCDYGKVSHLPWAIRFPKDAPAWKDHVYSMHALAPDSAWSLPVHPTQIYETLSGLAIFGLVMYLRRVRKFSGEVFLGWVVGYGIARPIIEIYRGDDDRGSVGTLSTSQFIGLSSVLAGIGLLIYLVKRYRADPTAARLWEIPLPAQAKAEPDSNQRSRRRRKGR